MYDYLDAMVEDIKMVFNDYDWDAETREELEEEMYDRFWIDDSVTGNGSGSYFCNSDSAKECVVDNMEILKDAVSEYCVEPQLLVDHFMNGDWEWMDCMIRTYLLGEAISQYLYEYYDGEDEEDE